MSAYITDIIEFGYGQHSYKEYNGQARGIFNDDPIKFLLDAAEQVHIGDRDAIEILLLSRISAHPCFNTKLNIALTGDSDEGKTHIGLTCLHMAPPEYMYETTRITPKVLYYEAMGR